MGSLPTWAGYNSLVTAPVSISTCQGMPLYPGSPTDWSNLYTSLKIAQGINVESTGSKTTIITLDLQLYAKAMQLRAKNDIKTEFVFRLGELHTVFAMLKCLGKYVEDSGLDKLFLEAGIYGELTLAQILNGKHMKRGMEAHMTMYLALHSIFIKGFQNRGGQLPISEIKSEVCLFTQVSSKDDLQAHHQKMNDCISKCSNKISSFEESLQNQTRYLHNYMKMFEVLLLFTRASRQGLWKLHLASLNKMVNYFFAHDQINYARLTPLYLATMCELEESDPTTWKYLEENFSIAKSNIPFTAIGSDHAMEQENKILKVNIIESISSYELLFFIYKKKSDYRGFALISSLNGFTTFSFVIN